MRINKILNLILFIILLSSCGKKIKQDFQLNIILSEPITKKSDEILPPLLDSVIRYFTLDSIGKDTVYIPNVTFIREDLGSEKVNYKIPLSSLNEFREKLGMLSVNNLMTDENYKAALKSTELLCKKAAPVTLDKNQYDNVANLIQIDKRYFIDSIEVIQSQIVKAITRGSNRNEVNLRIVAYIKPLISADSAYKSFKLESSQQQVSAQEIDSLLNQLEKSYPDYYLFTFEKFKRSVCGSRLKPTDTVLIRQIIVKASRQGKISEMKDSMSYIRKTCKIEGLEKVDGIFKDMKTAELKEDQLFQMILQMFKANSKAASLSDQNIREKCLDENWLDQISLENKLHILAGGTVITDNCKIKIQKHLKSITSPSAKFLVLSPDGSKIIQTYSRDSYYNRVLLLGGKLSIKVVDSKVDDRRNYIEIKLHEE